MTSGEDAGCCQEWLLLQQQQQLFLLFHIHVLLSNLLLESKSNYNMLYQ